jgi:hypothetical protein
MGFDNHIWLSSLTPNAGSGDEPNEAAQQRVPQPFDGKIHLAVSFARKPVLGRIEQRALEIRFRHRRLEIDQHGSLESTDARTILRCRVDCSEAIHDGGLT